MLVGATQIWCPWQMRMMMVPIGVCVQSGGGGDGCGTEEIGVGWLFARTVIVDMIVFFCLLE